MRAYQGVRNVSFSENFANVLNECSQLEVPFLGKFDPKTQNGQFKLKFGAQTNWNIQNFMVMFPFSIFDRKCLFGANLVQKIKIVSLS